MLTLIETSSKRPSEYSSESRETQSQEVDFSLENIISEFRKRGLDLEQAISIEKEHFLNIKGDLARITEFSEEYQKAYNQVLGLISLFDFNPQVLTPQTSQVIDENGSTSVYSQGPQLVYSRQAETRAIADLDSEKRTEIKILLIDIVGMSKMPKDVGDVAINKLVTHLNNIITNLGPQFEKYEVYIHRYGGDEIHFYLRTKDQFPYNPLKLENVYNSLKRVVSNNQFNPQDQEKTEYTSDIENYVWVEPRDKITESKQLAIRFEDVYIPDDNDRLAKLIWQLSVFRGLYPSQKEIEHQKEEILRSQNPNVILDTIRPEIRAIGDNIRRLFPGLAEAESVAIKEKLVIE